MHIDDDQAALQPPALQGAALLEQLGQSRDRWLAFARKRLNPDDAEDAVHAALERAVRRISTLRDPERLTAWFYLILRHAISDQLARRSRGERLSERLEQETSLSPSQVPPPTPDSPCDCGITLMEELPPKQIEVLERVILHEQPVREVARAMDTTPNATRVRLHRARVRLQASLQDHCGIQNIEQAHDCTCAC